MAEWEGFLLIAGIVKIQETRLDANPNSPRRVQVPGARARRVHLSCVLALAALSAQSAAQAATQSLTGSFTQDDERASIAFNVAMDGDVVLQTWSFGGGINAAGASIAAGGFAPVLSIFTAGGDLIGLAQAGVADCGACNTDAATGFRWDVSWSATLGAGSYLAVLTQDDNTPFGPALGDGFSRDGQGNFTGPTFLGADGAFILVDASQRDGHWALDVTTPVPEPATWAMLLAGVGLLALRAAGKPA